MAIIYYLTICHTCHHVIQKNQAVTIWEGSNYCDSCFDEYLELVEPSNYSNTEVTRISPVVE